MSVQRAFAFIQAVREDDGLRARVEALGPDARLEQVAALAGHAFTAEDLRAAHRHDWVLRSLRYAPPSPGPAPRS